MKRILVRIFMSLLYWSLGPYLGKQFVRVISRTPRRDIELVQIGAPEDTRRDKLCLLETDLTYNLPLGRIYLDYLHSGSKWSKLETT